jgi:anaerobic selenocysteine-containing dehydrogenase
VQSVTEVVRTYCSLCSVGCPAAVTLSGDAVLKLEPDREHPQGGAVCAKGRAAPEIHANAGRLSHPMKRTNPKTNADPGWRRITWDEALDTIAARLAAIRAESGAEAVAFGRGTGAGTGLLPAEPWLMRLAAAFGTPNYMTTAHLCSWARDGAALYTLGVAEEPLPDFARSATIVLWGANPSANELHFATAIVDARSRGAKLVVVDPRRVGLANKADLLLQVRPGTDGALALALIGEIIDAKTYDDAFVRRWTNAPLLVRADTGRLLRVKDLGTPAFDRENVDGSAYVAVARSGALAPYDPTRLAHVVPVADLALEGETLVPLTDGARVRCRTVFSLLAEEAHAMPTERAANVTGVPASLIRETAAMLAAHRPVSHHSYNGIIQHTNATQGARAIEILFTLLGDCDAPGGNVFPMPIRTGSLRGAPLAADAAARRLGLAERPLGPPGTAGHITAYDLYSAILEGKPYRVRGLLAFGGNVLMNSGDTLRGREALQRLEFFAQAELFETPASRYADVLLPATTFLENDTLVVTDDGVAQRRRRSVAPRDERRPDIRVIFDLAVRLGHADRFTGGSVTAAYDEVLEPAGLTWDELRDVPQGVAVADPRRYHRYAEIRPDGTARGFDTPSGLAELFVERFVEHGYAGIPRYEEPAQSPLSQPKLARKYPLVLTNAKIPQYLHSQGRGIPALRRTHPDPTAELHPDTARDHGIQDGEWIAIETPRGRVRAKADVTATIRPGVVCATHGWWEGCEELGLGGFDPFSEDGANVNLLVHNDVLDPISGAVPHRSVMCRVRPLEPRHASAIANSSEGVMTR